MALKDPEARKQYNREYRLKHLAEYTERDRVYRETHKDQIYERNLKYVDKNRDKQREWVKKASVTWRKKYGSDYYRKYRQDPEVKRRRCAHSKVYMAVRHGKLIRPDHCTVCGFKCKPHAHHDDYEKPLEVVWLCSPCHKQADIRRASLTA